MNCKYCGLRICKSIYAAAYGVNHLHEANQLTNGIEFHTCAYANGKKAATEGYEPWVNNNGTRMAATPMDPGQTEPFMKPLPKPFLVTKQLPVKPKKSRAPRKKKFVLPAVVGRKFRGA